MRSPRRVRLAASFVMTMAALPACDNAPKYAPNPPAPNPPPVASDTVAPSADAPLSDASIVAAPSADAGDDTAPPFHRHGPILNPPRPRPMPSGN
jgi:hypothetical protein